MAYGINRVFLLGNLGAEPELRHTQGGQAVLNMRVATTESYLDRNKERKERTDWHNAVLFGPRADALSRILRKGSQVLIEGRLQTSKYQDRDGNDRYKTEVVALNVLFTSGGRRDGGEAGQPASNHGLGDDDIGF